jgi:DNA-binding GntR family transcriptional regulator
LNIEAPLAIAVEPRNSAVSAAHRLERELRRAIVTLELLPGTRLSEQDIAQRFGVSRQPAREALIALAKTRLVEVVPQRGTVVVKLSVVKMMEARFVREAIEAAVVRRACESFSRQSRLRLDDLIEGQRRAVSRGDREEFRRYDELFHVALAVGAGCGLAWLAIEDLKAHMDRVCHLTLSSAAAMAPLIDQHAAIVAAIDAQDSDRAESAVRQHLAEILRSLPRIEAEYPHLFE